MPTPQDIYYEDLSLNPEINSQGDISTVTNKDSIKQSIRLIVNTPKGSRIFMPDYGCRVSSFLFEPFDESTASRIGAELQETLQNHEPRINILNINVNMDKDLSQYNVSISYQLVNTQSVDMLNITLERL